MMITYTCKVIGLIDQRVRPLWTYFTGGESIQWPYFFTPSRWYTSLNNITESHLSHQSTRTLTSWHHLNWQLTLLLRHWLNWCWWRTSCGSSSPQSHWSSLWANSWCFFSSDLGKHSLWRNECYVINKKVITNNRDTNPYIVHVHVNNHKI